jgi:hypothetical protein
MSTYWIPLACRSRTPYDGVGDTEADLPACRLDTEPPNARINAREKLTRLSKQQFHELSTDVYDELVRRRTDDQTSGAPLALLQARCAARSGLPS